MIRNLMATVWLVLVVGMLAAQDTKLYMPRQMTKAYEKGTRSFTGKPGDQYYQNKASYTIVADFDPETGRLEGEETIVYQNNSPDTLHEIVIRQYQNIFKKGVERDFTIGAKDLHNGVEMQYVKIEGNEVNLDDPTVYNSSGTVASLRLKDPLPPESSLKLDMAWGTQLPEEVTIRYGEYGKDNWFVAYWYPHIAVYDDVDGWHDEPFTGSAEFYYDFNDYDVKIALPEDYMAWGSGILQNPEGHYRANIRKRLKQAYSGNEVVHITTAEEVDAGNVLKNKQDNYWHFQSENQADFAFAVSKSYIWDATSAVVNPETDRRVRVNAVYKRHSNDFHQVAEISAKTIQLFSQKHIGVPFPHPQLTAFNGQGGMEFPMMINDGDARSYHSTVHLTTHEIGHNYYPFYVGTNEARYAQIDEGLVSYIPRLVAGDIDTANDPLKSLVRGYSSQAGTMVEVPLMTQSNMISNYQSYRLHAYARPANAYHVLHMMLGDADFRKAIEAYTRRWAYKHPTPYDLFFTFEDVLDMDLSWFWKPWFFEFGYPDLAIVNHVKNDDTVEVTVARKGKLPAPVKLVATYADGSTREWVKQADVWKDGEKLYRMTIPARGRLKTLRLATDHVPDAYPQDNVREL